MSNLKRYKNLSKVKDKTNVFTETDIKVENLLPFSGNTRITRSSLTKLQSLPPEPNNQNEKEIAAASSYKNTHLIADVNNFKSDPSSYISKKPVINGEVKPMYSLMALPIDLLAQNNYQDGFLYDNGDISAEYKSNSSLGDNILNKNIINLESTMNMDQHCSTSYKPFYQTIPHPMIIDTSRPPPPKICSFVYPENNSFRAVALSKLSPHNNFFFKIPVLTIFLY